MAKNNNDFNVKFNKKSVKVKTKNGKSVSVKYHSYLFVTIACIVLLIIAGILILKFGFPNAWDDIFNKYLAPIVGSKANGDLAVHFIDVGQGDCIIIQLPDGKNAIIDAGGDSENVTKEKCKDRILNNINSLRIRTFDYMILTHSDADHVDYMDTVLEEYDVKNIYRPAFNSTLERDKGVNPQYGVIETVTYNNFVKAVQNEQKEINAKVEFNIGKKEIEGEGYRFDIYGVSEEWYKKDKVGTEKQIDAKERNKVSPMVLLSYKSEEDTKRIMFTGDAEGKGGNGGEDLFLNNYKDKIDIDVLKIGHHGSASSASDEFLKRLDPEYAVISVGVKNNHGHPNSACLDRLKNYKDGKGQNGVAVYMTKYCGDIIFRINKQGAMSFDTDIKVAV